VVRRARHAGRPGAAYYLGVAFDGFFELHGDRGYRDDRAIIGGPAWLAGERVVVVGQERGSGDGEQLLRNFGMPFPEGYNKARRLMLLAAHFRLPLVTLVDTPGAYPGLGAEERGQAGAIARLLASMAALPVPTVSVILGQGGSGGALALAMTDRVLMFENAIYSVISPEGCASILFHSSSRAREAAAALRLTAHELHAFGLVDEVLPEPATGITHAPEEAATRLRESVALHLRTLRARPVRRLLAERGAKYAAMGVVRDARPGACDV
jgi:acetyl-CoA carboxylase carboxyl transferase alpha subunit